MEIYTYILYIYIYTYIHTYIYIYILYLYKNVKDQTLISKWPKRVIFRFLPNLDKASSLQRLWKSLKTSSLQIPWVFEGWEETEI